MVEGETAEAKDEVKVLKKSITEKVRENPWVLSTFIMGLLIVILLITSSGGITGKVISENKVGELALTFFNEKLSQTPGTLDSVKSINGIYQVNINIGGESIPLYFTKNGNWISQGGDLVSITGNTASNTNSDTQTQEISKSEKPSVELYVFTYCPYGTQAEKGILPVIELLGDKIDFKIRQIGAMHGEYEKIEAERQLCIEKEYPTKFLDYVLDFALSSEIGACGGDATCVNPLINSIYTKLGINANKINSCMTSDGVTMYNAELSNAQQLDVSGSPTLIINGVKVSSGRDSASYLDIICQAFSDGSVPEECGEQLSSAAPSPGFGTGTASSGSGSQCA